MRVLCRHGHYAFFPQIDEDIGRFSIVFDRPLFRVQDYFTFEGLKDFPDYSLASETFGGLPFTKTFEGFPWEVMEQNLWVYHLSAKKLVLRETINAVVELPTTGKMVLAPSPLMQAGCLNPNGKRLVSYDGFFSTKSFRLLMVDATYV